MLERWRPRALRLPARVGIILLLVCLATMASGSVALYQALSLDDDEMLDARLAALSSMVLGFAREELRERAADGDSQRVDIESDAAFGTLYRYQIWSPNGQLLLRTGKAPAAVPFGPLSVQGFRNVSLDGEQFRVLTMTSLGGDMILQMAQSLDERDLDIAWVSRRFLMFVGLPLCVIAVLAYRQIRQALAGLSVFTTQIQQLGVGNLRPIDHPQLQQLPPELAEMLAAINAVFQRVDSAVRAEQEFASMAAHELRSPLAGLRAQAQLALHLDDAGEVRAALRSVIEATDQAARVIEQLLDLARFEVLSQPTALPVLGRIDLADVVGEALDDVERLQRSRGVVIESRVCETTVDGHRGGLLTIARNLLNNALRYTPSGGRVLVAVEAAGDEASLVVEDSGPGIAAPQRAAALQRFNRLGRSDGEGVGLGLAIVQSVVRLHQATLELTESSLGGLRVAVRLRVSPPQARSTPGEQDPAR